MRSLGLRWLGIRSRPARHGHRPPPLQPGPGAHVHVAHPVLPRGQVPPEVLLHRSDVRVTTVRYVEAILAGGRLQR